MNVAIAAAAAPSATAFMTPRSGAAASEEAEGKVYAGSAAEDTRETAFGSRYPRIAFSFDSDSERLVMMYRDPDTGSALSQIPTEVALKQYKEAQDQEREKELRKLKLIVGGRDPSEGEGTNAATSTRRAFSVLAGPGGSPGALTSIGSAGAALAGAASAATAPSPTAAGVAAPASGASVGAKASSGVNLLV